MLEQGYATRRDFEKCKGTGEIGIGEGVQRNLFDFFLRQRHMRESGWLDGTLLLYVAVSCLSWALVAFRWHSRKVAIIMKI